MKFRTDMADERRDMYRKANQIENEISGIECEIEEKDDIKITRVKILNEDGEQALNKKKGNYITIDLKKISNLSKEKLDFISDTISCELKKILDNYLEPEDEVLVIGLGNDDLVADSLGSKVIDKIEVTRHIKKYYPKYLNEGERGISAIAPSVMGKTGIETFEIVKGVIGEVRPKLLIVIDSLASRKIERISKSIQISDTGIVPGGGVGNARISLSLETLNLPVIAIRSSNSC
jgi:spore protease